MIHADKLWHKLAGLSCPYFSLQVRLEELSKRSSRRARESEKLCAHWRVLDIIQHATLHLGRVQIKDALRSGCQSVPPPLWFERVPQTSILSVRYD